MKLNGVVENVEWLGVSWNIFIIFDFGEIEINWLVECEWELELGLVC